MIREPRRQPGCWSVVRSDACRRTARWLVAAATIAGASGVIPAHALSDTATVRELVGQCKEAALSTGAAFCLGELVGVRSMLEANGYLIESGTLVDLNLAKIAVCSTSGVTNDELPAVFLAWAERRADASDQLAAIGVVEALAARWPCLAGAVSP